MKSRLFFILAASLVSLGINLPVSAHHSFAAAYNMDNPIEITGKIIDVRLTNPHSYFFLDVVGENGAIERWSFEAGTPSGMIRGGY
jgi:hypothetical protein